MTSMPPANLMLAARIPSQFRKIIMKYRINLGGNDEYSWQQT